MDICAPGGRLQQRQKIETGAQSAGTRIANLGFGEQRVKEIGDWQALMVADKREYGVIVDQAPIGIKYLPADQAESDYGRYQTNNAE